MHAALVFKWTGSASITKIWYLTAFLCVKATAWFWCHNIDSKQYIRFYRTDFFCSAPCWAAMPSNNGVMSLRFIEKNPAKYDVVFSEILEQILTLWLVSSGLLLFGLTPVDTHVSCRPQWEWGVSRLHAQTVVVIWGMSLRTRWAKPSHLNAPILSFLSLGLCCYVAVVGDAISNDGAWCQTL